MDKTVKDQTVGDELKAAQECMIAAMNSLSGPYGKAPGRCVSDLYYACYHLANALLASKGISAGSHEAVQKLLALHFVRPAALPRDTTARLNDLMDKRHVADYRPYVPIGARDVAEFRPWIVGFVRDVLKVMGASAPAEDAAALRRAAGDLEKIELK
jgi:uncharacterized protein (UPF0332 family)